MGDPHVTDVERFGRLYVASRNIVRAIAQSRSPQELVERVVRILVEDGKFALAVISWVDPDTQELLPAAQFGAEISYIKRIRVFANDTPEGRGPAGTAFTSGEPYVCNDFLNDPGTRPWHAAARASGWRASAAFPITIRDVPRGVLSVYADDVGKFGPDQVELLRQVSLDVAFGMEHQRSEQERREAQEARLASQQKLQFVLDAAAVGAFDADLESGKVTWNSHCEHMFGYEAGTFEGTYTAFQSRVHPEDRAANRSATETARASHSTFSNEFRVVWPDGTERWLLARGRFHYDDNGRAYHLYGAVLDITERKRAEAALRESQARLQEAVDAADIGIFEIDHRSETLYASPNLRRIFGWDTTEPISLAKAWNLVHPLDREAAAAAVTVARGPEGNGILNQEIRLLLPDGSIRWVSHRARTSFSGEGPARMPSKTVGAIRDITERKEQIENQTKLATLVEMSRDFIGIATIEGQVDYLNQAAMDLVGIASIEEARQKKIFDFFAESELVQARVQMYKDVMQVGYWSAPSRFRHFRTGQQIDVDLTAFQIRDARGAPLSIATVTKDMTERRHMEAEKARLEEQLFQSQKMESIGLLAGGIAHDFNNLLTVINGYSHMALGSIASNSPVHHLITQIERAGQSAAALTRQLLAFSRKQPLQPRIFDLNSVVRGMSPMLERLLGSDVTLRLTLSPEPANVYADPHQIEQVILNLATNARDAMRRGGTLSLETVQVEAAAISSEFPESAPAARYVMLTVTDTGVGIDEEIQSRIFEPFFTTKPTGQGTGLGLSTAQGIIMQSGGHISVSSKLGKGTVFKIYLAAHAAQPIAAEPEVPIANSTRGRETVLIVEDLTEVRQFAASALESFGYRVLQAANADEAMSLCSQNRIDIVLSDVVMPGIRGAELAARLQIRYPQMKVLIMSGHAEEVYGSSIPNINFIEKPFNAQQLASKIRAILDRPETEARILITDDEDAVRGFLRTALEKGGYQVFEAKEGTQALQVVKNRSVDLVIVDLVMPEKEGLETIQALRDQAPHIPLIAISGAFEGRFLQVAKLMGACAVLPKPISTETLLTTVKEVLNSSR